MITPYITEKSYVESTKQTYTFCVPSNLSKQAIAKAVADEYKVTVMNVRTAIRKGKKIRFSRGKHAYPGTTYRQNRKIAYVTIKDGEKIPAFEQQQEEPKTDPKTTETVEEPKKTKRATKKANKEEQ